MTLADRLAAFEKLGIYIDAIDEGEFSELAQRIRNENSWFTSESIRQSLAGIGRLLDSVKLKQWASRYDLNTNNPKIIALVLAGNIPAVGFHDLLAVLVSGNMVQVKLSSKDRILITFLLEKLFNIEPRFKGCVEEVERLQNFDAVIATGSDNSSRYFEYYFGKYPHIIRKNRTSCAVLTGFETDAELEALGKDVFSYFGLGCRNVSKLFVPEEYEFNKLLRSWQPYENVIDHHKYHNNYDYQKSILLINRVHFLDTGFILLHESDKMVSPISVLFFEYYASWDALLKRIDEENSKIQCVVGNASPAAVKIGHAQYPDLWDYADQVDTMRFLESLN